MNFKRTSRYHAKPDEQVGSGGDTLASATTSADAGRIGDLRVECIRLREVLEGIIDTTGRSAQRMFAVDESLLAIAAERDALLKEKGELRERVAKAETVIEEMARDLSVAQRMAEESAQALEQERKEKDDLTAQLATKEFELEQTREEMERQVREAELRGQAKPGEEGLAEQLTAMQEKLAAVDAYFEKQQADHKKANAVMVSKWTEANNGRRSAEDALAEAQKQIKALTQQVEETRKELYDARADVDRIRVERAGPPMKLKPGDPGDTFLPRPTPSSIKAPEPGEVDAIVLPLRLADAPVTTSHSASEMGKAMAKMESALAIAEKAQNPAAAMKLLDAHLSELSLRALSNGAMATYRLLGVCAEVVQWMKKGTDRVLAASGVVRETLKVITHLADYGTPEAEADTNGASVYVLDVDMDNCECVAVALGKIGLKAGYAPNTDLAFKQLSEQPWNLVILDVELGTADGFEFHKRIRKVPHLAQTPVIFCGSRTGAKDRVDAMGMRQVSYVEKPYTLAALGLKALAMIVRARLPY